MDDCGREIHPTWRVKMTKKLVNWIGSWKNQFSENVMHRGGHWKDEEPGEDVVLDHIILDLTGDSVPLDHIADLSVQKEFKRKKRLLRKSNTVLLSRLGIMALVAVMLVGTTLLTWYFTSTYAARSVKSLATVLRQQLLHTSTQAMVSILGEVYNGTLVLCSLHQQVYSVAANTSWDAVEPMLRHVNRGVFNAQHQYTSVAFVAADGRLTDFTRSGDREFLFFVNESSSTNAAVWYKQNLTGVINDSQAPPPQLQHPPYPVSAGNVLALEPLQEVYWTIAPNSLGEAVVSPAVPVKDIITDDFLGAATITSTFEYLNSYLATIDLLGGFLYFEWHNGTGKSSIVAFSYNDPSDILASPYNSSNPVVRAAAYYLGSRYGSKVMSIGETHNEDVKLLGQKYYIDTILLNQVPYDNLNLTAVVILPRNSIMGRIDKRNQTVIHVIVGAAVAVLVLGCCFVCFLTSKMSIEMQLRQELIRVLVGKHRAEMSSNYKSQFLANMSHELRTPIAGIIGLLDLLSCDSLTLEQEFSVSQIRRCATGLLALVNNVLDISKVEAGKMELEVAPLCIADELESLVDMFAAQSVGGNIDLVLDLLDDIPPLVKADSTRIRQIFSNLLSNSLKFTTHGHVLIRGWVDQSLLEPKGKMSDFSVNLLSGRERVSGPLNMSTENQLALVFEVDDSGCGIAPELHETVFDSFVQGDSSTTRTHGGSGLGLYMVRSLVELMGGEVAVVPSEGPGTVMRFHIVVERAGDPMPLHRASTEGAQAFGSPGEQDGLDSLLGSPINVYEPFNRSIPEGLENTQILVAMQEGVARNVAVYWLERSGLNVKCVEAWADVIPTLENMCKNYSAELKAAKVRAHDPGGRRMGSLSFPMGGQSPEFMSELSYQMSESSDFPSVLALVDVTSLSDMKGDFDRKLVDFGVLGPNESILTRAEVEKLPCHMQEMLDSMLRIHFQRSVAVSWLVAPDCGAKWKQALQADGCFLVLNKPLHGSRLRRLLTFLARAGKLEPHHWEVHSSLFGSPLSPGSKTAAGTPFPEAKHLESSPRPDHSGPCGPNAEMPGSRRTSNARRSVDGEPMNYKPYAKHLESSQLPDHNDPGGQNAETPGSRRTSNARKSVDGEPMNYKPYAKHLESSQLLDHNHPGVQTAEMPGSRRTSNARKSVDGELMNYGPYGLAKLSSADGPQQVAIDIHRGVELSKRSGDKNNVVAPQQRASDFLSDFPDDSGKGRPDKKGSLHPPPRKSFQRTPSQNSPSHVLQGLQQKVPPVGIPEGSDERRRLLSINTPESPVSGRSTPRGPFGAVTKPHGEMATADGVQEVRKNGIQLKDGEEDSGGRLMDLGLSRKLQQQKQSEAPGQASTIAVGENGGQTSHEIPPSASPERGSRASSPASAFIHKALAGIHILLVEDTAVLQRLVSMTLKKLGANVTVVGDGLQAVTAVAETVEATRDSAPAASGLSNTPHYDLILMDCAMPVMDGYNATKAIRVAEENTERHIPIVALTAHALASDEERCLSVGMDAYLTKPINCKLMAATIRGLLGKGKT